MRHVRPYQVSSSKGAAQTQFASQHGSGNDPSQATSVVSGIRRVCALDAEHVEHGLLRLEDRAASDRADFDARHAHRELQVAVQATAPVSVTSENGRGLTDFFMTVMQLADSTT